MQYLIIKEDTQQAKAFYEYIKTLPFVEIVEVDDENAISKKDFINDLRKSLKEVKAKKTKPLKTLLDGK